MHTVAEKSEKHNDFKPRFGIIPHWVLQLKLPGSELQTLLTIACHANKTRCARGWSVETIAADAGLARGNVQRAIRGLEKKGVLEITPGCGRGRSNSYRIIFEPAASLPLTDEGLVDPRNSLTGDADLNSANGDAVSDKTASISAQNSVAGDAPSTDIQKRTLSNESDARARARCSFARGDFAVFWEEYPPQSRPGGCTKSVCGRHARRSKPFRDTGRPQALHRLETRRPPMDEPHNVPQTQTLARPAGASRT